MPPKKVTKANKSKKDLQQPQKEVIIFEEETSEDTSTVPRIRKIPQKLHLKNINLNHVRKGLVLRVKHWKCVYFRIDQIVLAHSIDEAITGLRNKKASCEEKLWRNLENCIPKNNRYFRRLEVLGYAFKIEKLKLWQRLYHKHKVPEILLDGIYLNKSMPIRFFKNIETLSLAKGSSIEIKGLNNLSRLKSLRLDISGSVTRIGIHNFVPRLTLLENLSVRSPLPLELIEQTFNRLKRIKTLSLDLYIGKENNSLILDTILKEKLPNLKSLSIAFSGNIADFCFKCLNGCSLNSLHLDIQVYSEVNWDITCLQNQPNLKELTIKAPAKLVESILKQFNCVPNLSKLKLKIDYSESIKELCSLLNEADKLVEFDFFLRPNKKNIEFYQNLKIKPKILRLRTEMSTKEHLSELKAFGEFLLKQTQVETLFLHISTIRVETIEFLKKAFLSMKNLKYLNLYVSGHQGLPEQGLRLLTDIFAQLTWVEILDLKFLERNFKDDEMRGIINDFRKIKKLRSFSFEANFASIGDEVFEYLIDFVKSKDVRSIHEMKIIPNNYRRKQIRELHRVLQSFQGLTSR